MSASLPVGRILPVFCLVLILLGFPAHAAVAPEVQSSTRDEVRFSLELPAPQWRPAPSAVAGVAAWDAVLRGYRNEGRPGGVRLPRSGGWLVVPPGTTPQLEVVHEDWRSLAPRTLAIEPIPVMQPDPEDGQLREVPFLPAPGEPLPREGVPETVLADLQRPDPALRGGPAVRLGEVAWWRGRRIVSCSVVPLRTDGAGQAAAHLAGGEWRVRFVADPEAGKAMPGSAARRLGSKGDERFAGVFLNGELLQALPTEAAHAGPAARADRPAGARTKSFPQYPEVRIPVRRTQLHRVEADELREDGLLPDTEILESQLRLYQRRYVAELDDPADGSAPPYIEVEVPIHVVGEGDAFDGDDLFLFWGLRLRDDLDFAYDAGGRVYQLDDAGDPRETNNDQNIYWLQVADPEPGESWARMAQASLPPAAGPGEPTYRRTDRWNEAVAYRENVPNTTVDRYYYNTILDDQARVGLSFWSPDPAQVDAVVRAGVANYGTVTRNLEFDLVVEDAVQATLPAFATSSPNERVYEAPLPTSILLTSGVALRMRNAIGVLPLYSSLDWVEVRYDALYEAPSGRLQFPGGDPLAVNDLVIPGFPSEDVGLVEVTDPRNPVWIALVRSNFVDQGGSYALSIQVDQTGGQREFYAATRMDNTENNGVLPILYSSAELADDRIPTELADDRADVLVICHPDFRAGLQPWLDYRLERDPDLRFHVVAPQAIYDWYSGGVKDPWAIKRLVNHALASPTWGTWALVLVGDSNENPREIGVTSGREWAHDWVPTHYHVQTISSLQPEVLGSDEWFANPDADDSVGFPSGMTEPADLYVGRMPINDPAELARLLTKIQQVENAQPGEAWRKRGIFMADDAWSSGTLDAGGFTLEFQPGEVEFETSEAGMALAWEENAGLVALEADTVWLRPFMEPFYPEGGGTVPLTAAREWCEQSGAPDALISALSRGATVAHYQGHANHWLLTHEVWFQHDTRGPTLRRDIDELTNVGKPWLFCGMGCHLGDWIQNVAHASGNLALPGLGEKLLLWTDAGAVAVYASSGYEFLQPNLRLSEHFLDRMVLEPPSVTITGEQVASRWLLGELIWAAEADLLAQSQSITNRAMVYQYVILGDPLMTLDAGPPEVDAELVGTGGGPIEGEVELRAIDPSGQRQLAVQARDEAGIAQLRVRDTAGADLTSAVVTGAQPQYDNGSRQIMNYTLAVPVRPFPHAVLVEVFDTADRGDLGDHYVLTLEVEHETTVTTADGEPLDPQTFVFEAGVPVDLHLAISSAAWFDEETAVEVTGEDVAVTAQSATVIDPHNLEIDLTVAADAAKADRGVNVAIDGFETFVLLAAADPLPGSGGISGLINVPNPMREDTRFVFDTDLGSGRGKLRIWTVSGRSVAEVPFALAGGGNQVVHWDGRDREGDRLANGTYLYRVEIDGGAGEARSGMQRLVIMR